MKKILSTLVVSLVTFLTMAQTQTDLIKTFMSSKEFVRIDPKVRQLGSIDVAQSKVNYIDNDAKKPVLNIVITKEKNITGIIEIIPLASNAITVLANNDKYIMQLIDYSNYDLKTKTGIIKTYDLNYENYLSSSIEVNSSSITKFDSFRIPAEISSRHPADANGNGNVSFGECMGYMQSACNGSANCATMCTIVNLGGIGTTIGGQCTISMAAACVYLSIKY